jgi:acetylcholinesterase
MDRVFISMQESGSPIPLNDITANQRYFDQLVVDAGCQGSADPIACLRTLPFDKLGDAINQSPSLLSYLSFAFVWGPSIDGLFIKRDPQESLLKGLYARVFLKNDTVQRRGIDFTEHRCRLSRVTAMTRERMCLHKIAS